MHTERQTLKPLLGLLLALAGILLTSSVHAAPLKILIYGGTGNIGQRIVAEALQRGETVTVIARYPERAPLPPAERLHVVAGDVLDTESVTRALQGEDVVVSALNSGRGNDSEGADFLLRATQSLITAERALGSKAPRLLVVGGAGTLEVQPGTTALDQMRASAGGKLDPSFGPVQQQQVLEYLRTVGDIAWSYLSPSMMIEPGTRTGKFRLGGDQLLTDAAGKSHISMEDYAVALLDEADHPQHLHKRFTVGY
jgi:putative NADH-flavin reductase